MSKSNQKYNHEPKVFSNYFLNSFYIIFLIYCHPSAWRKLIRSIDSDLSPDFCLSDLNVIQWQNRSLRRLIFQGQIVAPFSICFAWVILSFGLLQNFEIDIKEAIAFISMVLMGSVSVCITSSIIIGFALGIAGGCAICLFGGVAIAIATGFSSISGIESVAIAVGLAGGGISGGVALGLINTPNKYSTNQQIGGVLIGIFIGLLAGSLSGLVGAGLSINDPSTLNLGLQLGFVFTNKLEIFYVLIIIIILILWGLFSKYTYRKIILFIFPSVAFLFSVNIARNIYLIDSFDYSRSVVFGSVVGISLGIIFSILFGLSRAISNAIAGPISGAIAGAVASGGFWFAFLTYSNYSVWFLGIVSIFFALTMPWWRPILLYPILTLYNLILYRLEISEYNSTGSYFQFHSAFWDEHQILPLIGLVQHLVFISKNNPHEGKLAIEYLYQSRQIWAAQAAQVELDLIVLENCNNIDLIRDIHNKDIQSALETEADAHLREFIRTSEKIDELCKFGDSYYKHCALEKTKDRLNIFIRELTRSRDKFSKRCRPIACHWYSVIDFESKNYLDDVYQSNNFPDFYSYGKPLPYNHHAFIGREKISAKIEKLVIEPSCPPLLLYGQRRIGKTSLLKNLAELLPQSIIPVFIDLQGPISACESYSAFLHSLSEEIIYAAKKNRDQILPSLSYEDLLHNPFKSFDKWIDKVENSVVDKILLVTLDEYEVLSKSFSYGYLSEEKILGFFRNLIQHRNKLKFIFSGAHQLVDYPSWSNYLINLQVVYIDCFTRSEAMQLIYLPSKKGFDIEYSQEALEYILKVTRRHPGLLQLICSEIIRVHNSKKEPLNIPFVTLNDVLLSVDNAIKRGALFFQDIEYNRLNIKGLNTIDIVKFIAFQGEDKFISKSELLQSYSDEFMNVLPILVSRDILEKKGDCFRIKIELVRKWFCKTYI